MRRIYRPAFNWDDDYRTHVPSCTVIEAEPINQFSGLLDTNGNKLMVTVQPNPIGFVIFPTPPLTEGHVVKGGRNQGPSQIVERPPPPGAIRK